MNWKPSRNDPKYLMVCGRWSIAKVWGYHERAYVYELRYEDGSRVGARFGTFASGKLARDEAYRWELGTAFPVRSEADKDGGSLPDPAPVERREGRFDELRRIIEGDREHEPIDGG